MNSDLNLAKDKAILIEKAIKTNRKYVSNEDLYEDFFNETYRRSLAIINNINSEIALESYLRKIASTSIITVLKDSGRLRRTREGFIPAKEVSFEEISTVETPNYSSIRISYPQVQIEEGPEDIAIKNEILSKISETIADIDTAEPEKQYAKMYNMRYLEGMTQAEIAETLGVSQSEISKRLFRLMNKVKQAFN